MYVQSINNAHLIDCFTEFLRRMSMSIEVGFFSFGRKHNYFLIIFSLFNITLFFDSEKKKTCLFV